MDGTSGEYTLESIETSWVAELLRSSIGEQRGFPPTRILPHLMT